MQTYQVRLIFGESVALIYTLTTPTEPSDCQLENKTLVGTNDKTERVGSKKLFTFYIK